MIDNAYKLYFKLQAEVMKCQNQKAEARRNSHLNEVLEAEAKIVAYQHAMHIAVSEFDLTFNHSS